MIVDRSWNLLQTSLEPDKTETLTFPYFFVWNKSNNNISCKSPNNIFFNLYDDILLSLFPIIYIRPRHVSCTPAAQMVIRLA